MNEQEIQISDEVLLSVSADDVTELEERLQFSGWSCGGGCICCNYDFE